MPVPGRRRNADHWNFPRRKEDPIEGERPPLDRRIGRRSNVAVGRGKLAIGSVETGEERAGSRDLFEAYRQGDH